VPAAALSLALFLVIVEVVWVMLLLVTKPNSLFGFAVNDCFVFLTFYSAY
jgi:hypothetical protein